MKITKLEQSGLIIEKNGHSIVIDPVELSSKIPTIENIDAVIITHQHSDHFQPEVVKNLCSLNPTAKLFVADDMINQIEQPTQTAPVGETIQIGEFKITFFGIEHTPIFDNISPCKNFGVIIDDFLVDPGDSFAIPPIEHPNTLCVAISGPWLKMDEIMEYILGVRPKKVIPIHDALLSPLGRKITDNWVKKACDSIEAEYISLSPGENTTI
jgi:L-ascorbate metabolism protein UlaG (beta-lactamase superfamily)